MVYESILGLFLESQLIAMTAFSLSAVGGLEGKGGVALTADLLVAVVFLSNSSDGGVHHTASESEDEVESRLFLDVVVGKASAICIGIEVPSSCLPAKMSLC